MLESGIIWRNIKMLCNMIHLKHQIIWIWNPQWIPIESKWNMSLRSVEIRIYWHLKCVIYFPIIEEKKLAITMTITRATTTATAAARFADTSLRSAWLSDAGKHFNAIHINLFSVQWETCSSGNNIKCTKLCTHKTTWNRLSTFLSMSTMPNTSVVPNTLV